MSMAATEKYTPTQKRILHVLSDGLSHTKEELKGCLWDELCDVDSTLENHISQIRKRLPKGQDIISKRRPDGSWGYSHVRVVKITDE